MSNEGPIFSEDELAYMAAARVPIARFNKRQAALALGFRPHNLKILIRRRLLVPLGSLSPYCEQFFCAKEILDKGQDKVFLAKATRILQEESERLNAARKPNTDTDQEEAA